MKLKNLPGVLALTAIILFSSFSMNYPSGSPVAKTGSPGDGSDCSSCHGGTATVTAGLITSNIPVAGYTPGQTYQITATNTLTGSGKYGFEVSPQNAGGTQLGTLAAGTASKLVGGTKYVTQSTASSSTHIWTFNWTAPVAGTGAVTFYGAFARNYSGPTTLSTLSVQEGTLGPAAAGTITGSATVCINNTESYSVGTISGATSYVWAVPAGATILSGQGTTSISVSFTAAAVSGNTSVYGSNASGNGAPSNKPITINSVPSLAGTVAGSATPCQTSSQTYSVTNVPGITYTWSVPSGSMISSGQGTNSVNVTIGGINGNISVVPSNNCGTASASDLAMTVSPVPAQTGSISGENNPCQLSSKVYSVTNVSGVTYTWNVPSGSVIASGQGTNSITVTIGGNNGNISVVPSNSCGNAISTSLLVSVNLVPAQTSAIAGNSIPCQSNTQDYSVTSVSGITYTWSVPSGSVINSGQGSSSINVAIGANSGAITVVPSNSCGTGISTNRTITVNSAPAQTSAIAGNNNPCQSTSQVYSVTNVSGVSYAWSVPSGSVIASGQGTSSVHVTIGSGSGDVSVVPSSTCGSGISSIFPLSVGLLPSTPALPLGPDQVNLQNIISSDYTTATVADSYLWQLNPATAGTISGTIATAHVNWNIAFIGNAAITVKGVNACGESASSAVKTTQVLNTTGIGEDASGIRILANESAGLISLEMNTSASQASVMLLDLSGRVLVNTTVAGQGTQLISRQLKAGIYIIMVDAGSFNLKKKILVY